MLCFSTEGLVNELISKLSKKQLYNGQGGGEVMATPTERVSLSHGKRLSRCLSSQSLHGDTVAYPISAFGIWTESG